MGQIGDDLARCPHHSTLANTRVPLHQLVVKISYSSCDTSMPCVFPPAKPHKAQHADLRPAATCLCALGPPQLLMPNVGGSKSKASEHISLASVRPSLVRRGGMRHVAAQHGRTH